MVELLSPAGNFISLRAVLENGADATYFGLDDFNMRANAKNFSLNDLSEVSKIAKQYSAKTYLCSNVILNEDRAVELKNNLEEIAASEIDGIILSDIGLIEDVVDNGLEAHISVQENTSNSFMLKTLKKLGAKRAILSRELSLSLRPPLRFSWSTPSLYFFPARFPEKSTMLTEHRSSSTLPLFC